MEPIEFHVYLGGLRHLAAAYPKATRKETLAVLDIIVRRLESEVVQRTPKGVGGSAGLSGSIAGETWVAGETVHGAVGTPMAYGEVVEKGRRPGGSMPPTAPIELWARSILGLPPKEAKRAAFAIARHIAVHGTEGAEMFGKTMAELDGWIMSMLATIANRVVREVER